MQLMLLNIVRPGVVKPGQSVNVLTAKFSA